MSSKERAILENLSKSLEKINDSQREYLIGFTDGLALANVGKRKSNRKPKQTKQV